MKKIMKTMQPLKKAMVMVLLVLGVVSVVNYFSCEVDAVYAFDSCLDIEDNYICSTKPIQLPNYLQDDGNYEYINNTGYKICIFDRTAGFVELAQGENEIIGHPLALFVVSPDEADLTKESAGELIVTKEGTPLSACYTFKTDKQQSIGCSYRLEI